MKTCICTVIKDEQEYLEDWIKYHLELGIDKIFILEDIDSTSHKYITDKYIDNVELYTYDKFGFTEKQKQLTLLNTLLKYLKSLKEFDWCFVIDADEYITLENENEKLTDILDLFKDYSEVVIFWKNFGTNGHIHKPDYSKVNSYREYYTKECDYSNFDKHCNVINKFIVNLNKEFNPKCNFHHHHPCSNFIKTNFGKDIRIPVFDKIYLKHYITKSLEEYIWKLKVRGMFFPKHRKIKDLFEMEPDLLEYKSGIEKQLKININK